MNPWFVVQTEPQREYGVHQRLKGGGFEPYWPRICNGQGRIASLFPTYLFVAAADRWYAVRSTIGVRAVLMSGPTPALLPAPIIHEIRSRERADGLVRLPPPPRHRRGDKVAILRGAFRNRIAVYVGMSGRDRERVLIEALGRMLTLDLPIGHLAPPSYAKI